jgi:tetratricopeptide (TPR) repeat protein
LQVLAGQETGAAYGVGWGCADCEYKALDVCPLGPLVPAGAVCLGCGADLPAAADAACSGCGLSRAAALAFLLPEPFPGDAATATRDLFGRGLFRRGLALLNVTLMNDPGEEAPWLLKCTFLEGLGLHTHLLRMLEEALTAGGPPSLLIFLGTALQRAGRHDEALAASRRYLEAVPDGHWAGTAHGNVGLALRALGRHDEAEEMYRRAVEVDPGRVTHYRNLAQLLIDQRRWAGALGALEAGLDKAATTDEKVRLLEGLAFVCAEEERAAQALEYVDRAVALGAKGGRTLYLRGRALALSGRLSEARDEVRRVLELEPENGEAKQALAMIEKALGGA